jgi:hypothetical protein
MFGQKSFGLPGNGTLVLLKNIFDGVVGEVPQPGGCKASVKNHLKTAGVPVFLQKTLRCFSGPHRVTA